MFWLCTDVCNQNRLDPCGTMGKAVSEATHGRNIDSGLAARSDRNVTGEHSAVDL